MTQFKIWMTLTAICAILAPQMIQADALEGKISGPEILKASSADDWRELDPENTLYIELETGRVIVSLSPDLAQKHVEQIKTLSREGFYDDLSFYRVIDGFVAQGGDVFEKRDVGDAKNSLKEEFEEKKSKSVTVTEMRNKDGYAAKVGMLNGLPVGLDEKNKNIWHLHCTGAMAMARSIKKDTGSTEFYITLQPQRYLDRNLSVFGRVVRGMEHLQALRRVTPAEKEGDDIGETIKSFKIAADLPIEKQTRLEILKDSTDTFRNYVEARRNRPAEFFYHRSDYIDVCAVDIPMRDLEMPEEEKSE